MWERWAGLETGAVLSEREACFSDASQTLMESRNLLRRARPNQKGRAAWKIHEVEGTIGQRFVMVRGKQIVMIDRENQVVQCEMLWKRQDWPGEVIHQLCQQTVILVANLRLLVEPLAREVQEFGVPV